MTAKHEAEIAAMYVEQEHTIEEIARRTLFSRVTIGRVLQRQGIKTRVGTGGAKRRLSAEQASRTIWLHEQGLSRPQIAEILGITVSAVGQRLAKLRKELDQPPSRKGCWGRAGEPKTLPLHVRRTVEGWEARDERAA